MDRQVDRWHIFNPGSVGLPLDGIPSASYMILEGDTQGWKSRLRRVSFDRETVFREFEESGYNSGSGPIGRLILEIHKIARPTFGFLKWREIHQPNKPLSHELLDEYFANCKWWEFSHPAYHINMESLPF
jgi:hypothetical protein